MKPCAFCESPSAFDVWGHRACKRCAGLWIQVADKELPPRSSAEAHQEFTDRLVKRAQAKRGAA